MEQNKTRAYIFYAIGEIALVMIGILLALQVNNWNEERKSTREEIRILTSLVEDLEQASLESERQIKLEQNSVSTLKMLLTDSPERELFFSNPKADSLFYAPLMSLQTEIPVIQTYADLKSSGQVSLINNDLIRKRLALLENSLIELYGQTQDNMMVQQLNVDKIGIQKVDLTRILPSARPVSYSITPFSTNNYRELLNDQEFINVLTLKLIVSNGNLIYRKELDEKISSLISLINQELE